MEKVIAGEPEGEDLQVLFDTLRHLTETLESGSLSLEEAMKTYEEAVAVGNRIRTILADIDKKVMLITKDKVIPFYSDE